MRCGAVRCVRTSAAQLPQLRSFQLVRKSAKWLRTNSAIGRLSPSLFVNYRPQLADRMLFCPAPAAIVRNRIATIRRRQIKYIHRRRNRSLNEIPSATSEHCQGHQRQFHPRKIHQTMRNARTRVRATVLCPTTSISPPMIDTDIVILYPSYAHAWRAVQFFIAILVDANGWIIHSSFFSRRCARRFIMHVQSSLSPAEIRRRIRIIIAS